MSVFVSSSHLDHAVPCFYLVIKLSTVKPLLHNPLVGPLRQPDRSHRCSGSGFLDHAQRGSQRPVLVGT